MCLKNTYFPCALFYICECHPSPPTNIDIARYI